MAKRKVSRSKQQLALEGFEVGGVPGPFGRMDLLLTMHGRDRNGNPVPIEFAVFDRNVDQLLATLQEGVALYKTMQALDDT